MKRWLMYAGLLALAGLTFLTGCPSKTPPPAGPGIGSTPITPRPTPVVVTHQVTMSVTDSQIKVTPPSIPPGAASIKVTNTSKSDKNIVFSGVGLPPESKEIKPGETTTLDTSMLKPGTYAVTVPAPKSGGKTISSKLLVGAPSPMPHPVKTGKPMPGKPGGPMAPHPMPGMTHTPPPPPPAPK